MITVMGATGHTGKKITTALLNAGEKVRALGRSRSRLAELESAGAEIMTGDTADSVFLASAFQGADAVYTLLATDRQSPDYQARQDEEGEAIAQAIGESGVRYVVALSSLGADSDARLGVIEGLHAHEERLKQLTGTNLFLLRPSSFFENFYDQLPLMKYQGVVADSVAPDLAIPMVATADIADAAVVALRARDWKGVAIRELLGHRDLSYVEVTAILAGQIGRPDLQYVQLSYSEMEKALVDAGLSPSFAALYVQMTRAFNDGTLQSRRTAENTTSTRFEDFAAELAHAYQEV